MLNDLDVFFCMCLLSLQLFILSGPPSAPSGVAAYSRMSSMQFPSGGDAGGNTAPAVMDQDALLRWTEPIDNHGSDIISYIIYGKTNYSDEWHTVAPCELLLIIMISLMAEIF